MTSTWRVLLFLIVMMSLFQPAYAQQAQTVVLTEPVIIRLENLFQMADTVALVKVLSGDTQNYPKVIYKAEVVKSFKERLLGKRFISGRAWELDWAGSIFSSFGMWQSPWRPTPPQALTTELSIIPKCSTRVTVRWRPLTNVYSMGRTLLRSVATARESVRTTSSFQNRCTPSPPMTEDTPFGCRWVRKEALLSALDTLHESGK